MPFGRQKTKVRTFTFEERICRNSRSVDDPLGLTEKRSDVQADTRRHHLQPPSL